MKSTLSTSVARRLLDDRIFDIEFHGYLSNHVKHAIIALDRLEASSERIQEYWDEYTTMTPYQLQLHKVEKDWSQVETCSIQQWREWKGKKMFWQEQVAFMERELKERFAGDIDRLVQEYATADLLSGLAGSLTHGMIHLGWAIDARSEWMVAEGLAYLNFGHLGVDGSKFTRGSNQESTLFQSIIRVAKQFETENLQKSWVDEAKLAFDENFHPELICAGFQWQLSKVLHAVHPAATEIPPWLLDSDSDDDQFWESLYKSVVMLYLATRSDQGHGNFLVLHAITMLWGLEKTLKVVGCPSTTLTSLQHYYSSLICILATSRFPSSAVLQKTEEHFENRTDAEDYDWTMTVQQGIAEQEEHNIKLVYVTKALWERYGRWNGFSEAGQSFTLTPNIGPASEAFKTD